LNQKLSNICSQKINEFSFQPLKKTDLPLLFDWLALPHIAEWWRESRDWEIFSKKYIPKITAPDIQQVFIIRDGKRIGYIHSYEDPGKIFGLDLFIADTESLGKGYSVPLIKQFIHQFILPLGPKKIGIDPEITNVRAIHVYEKVGFKKTHVGQTTDGTKMVIAQFMELDPKTL